MEKEKNYIKLFEACLDRAEKERFKRNTKSNLYHLLIDEEFELTVTSRDLLYHQMNLKIERI